MTTRSLVPCALLALAACGGGSSLPPARYGGHAPPSARAPATYGGRAPSPARASLEAQTSPPELSRESEARPGLGTSWGESMTSRVREVEFERSSDAPFVTARLFYNDAPGVAALVDREARQGATALASAIGPIPLRGGLGIALVDEAGRPLPSRSSGGRIFVVGEAGRHYAIRIENHTAARVEAVLSVDGLDVVDGRPADAAKRGYVIDAGATLLVDGFRRSSDEIAAFRFGAVDHSYAAATGDARDVGVIGCALFTERGAAIPDEELDRRLSAEPFCRYATPPGSL